eukprot:TRINITY_DN953_c0_g1_i1.p1 TRINITY_DN953_c0_g1~~TRINITY_DN953_c0_g1_i1.p1  ORF type:complete len:192 (-),score=46.21 TRINITY_DN953_c0_g1_i1:108-635(-)
MSKNNSQVIDIISNFMNTPKEEISSFNGKYVFEIQPDPSKEQTQPPMFWTVEVKDGSGHMYPGGELAIVTLRYSIVYKVLQRLQKDVGGSLTYDIETKGGVRNWRIDLKPGLKEKKADAAVKLSAETLGDILTKKTDAQTVFMKGLIKVSGNLALAMKFGLLLDSLTHQIKQGKL